MDHSTIASIDGNWSSSSGIRCRVILKTEMGTSSKSGRTTTFFSVHLLDESAEIRATAFNKDAERLYSDIEVGKVYEIQNFRVKNAQREYSSVAHDWEITFWSKSVVIACLSHSFDIPHMKFNFTNFANIRTSDPGHLIDVIGVCHAIGDLCDYAGEGKKRELFLADNSSNKVMITLWNLAAMNFDDALKNHVIAFKGVKITDYSGMSLSCRQLTTMEVDPDVPEKHVLAEWFVQRDQNEQWNDLSCREKNDDVEIEQQWKLLDQKLVESEKNHGIIRQLVKGLKAAIVEKRIAQSVANTNSSSDMSEPSAKQMRFH